mgnify:CR=1 FL=1
MPSIKRVAKMEEFDVIVVGRGVMGNLAALTASKANLRVLVVGPKENVTTKKVYGSRSYALSPSSIDFISSVTEGKKIELEDQNISSMHIISNTAKVILKAEEVKKKYLAKIVNHSSLMDYLLNSNDSEFVKFLETKPQSIDYKHTDDGERIILQFFSEQKTFQVSSKLIIGADGVSSWVRQSAGISWAIKNYNQKAIVSEIVPENDHQGVACQWFYNEGILALLPCHNGNLSMVWSVKSSFADRIMKQPLEIFLNHLHKISRGKFGILKMNTKPISFNLSMSFADNFYGKRIALLGDSAHTVHPLAGLGLNLGIYDLISLVEQGDWFRAEKEPLFDPGHKRKLLNFHKNRVRKIPLVQHSLDSLVGLFAIPGPFASSVRSMGMNFVDNSSLIKSNLIKQAQTVI